MEVWDRLKAAREAKGWTQGDFAAMLGMSQQKYHPYEHGREMKTSMLIQACAVLECSPNWLLGVKDIGQNLAPDSLLLRQLKEAFDLLSTDGQKEALRRVQELTQLPQFRRAERGDGPNPGVQEVGA